MKTLVITDVRIFKIGDRYYAKDGFYRIIERYNNKFNNPSLITRIIYSSEVPIGFKDITDLCDKFINVHSIKHAMFIKNDKQISNEIMNSDFIILRVPSLISIFLFRIVKKYNKKYMTEVMGCAWDALWNHSLSGKLIAPYAYLRMKKIVKNADYAIYVTQKFLQNRYPCRNKNIGVSNVNISEIVSYERYQKNLDKKNITMMTAAAIDVKYKGQQYVIKAMKKLNDRGIFIKYYLAGGGSDAYLKKIVKKNKLENQVVFMGSVPHDELIEKMKNVDFYIQPSLQEGLPRSVIEAMSCGCVCLGSTTAGIPELLNDEQVFKRHSVKSIVNIIENNVNYNLNKISKENIEKSKEYMSEKLNERRYKFFDELINDINRD